jgi:hypothetical protein
VLLPNVLDGVVGLKATIGLAHHDASRQPAFVHRFGEGVADVVVHTGQRDAFAGQVLTRGTHAEELESIPFTNGPHVRFLLDKREALILTKDHGGARLMARRSVRAPPFGPT